jgi:hypothetical protein
MSFLIIPREHATRQPRQLQIVARLFCHPLGFAQFSARPPFLERSFASRQDISPVLTVRSDPKLCDHQSQHCFERNTTCRKVRLPDLLTTDVIDMEVGVCNGTMPMGMPSDTR